MNLTLSGIVVESSNGDEIIGTQDFIVNVDPTASFFLILAKNVEQDASGVNDLDLAIRMLDTRGTDVGETPEEVITLEFTNVPEGLLFHAKEAGRLVDNGGGSWTFTGTEAQANALSVLAGPNYDTSEITYDVKVSAATQDGDSIYAPAIEDEFRVYTFEPANEGLLLEGNATFTNIVGDAGNDVLVGFDSGGSTTMNGGAGMDVLKSAASSHTMTGGDGADRFVLPDWSVVTNGSPDVVTDFNVGQGDQLDLVGLTSGFTDLKLQFIDTQLSTYVQLVQVGSHTHVNVLNGGVFETVVILENTSGLDPLQMYRNGNLMV